VTQRFERTLRALERQRPSGAWLIPALVLLACWGVWMLRAELAVYATTRKGRVEVERVPSHIAAEAGGRISRLHLQLDQTVDAGDELVVLDSSVQDAQLEQYVARLEVLEKKRAGVEAQLTAERGLRASRTRLAAVITERGNINLQRAEASAWHQEALTEIAQRLGRDRLNSELEVLKANGELLLRRIAVADATTEVARLAAERDYEDKGQLSRIAELERQLIDVEVERVATQSAIATGRAELSRRRVLAPVSGYIGHLAPVQLGDVVQAGQILATIVPTEDVRVIAHFPPAEAVGLALPGQPARVRIDGFSWVEFGAIEATVVRVASEALDGLIRVELALNAHPSAIARLQHGQTASVDIETEVTTPWALLLRRIGAGLGSQIRPREQTWVATESVP
jgi:membrane fusion protein (multidrug efflux system)